MLAVWHKDNVDVYYLIKASSVFTGRTSSMATIDVDESVPLYRAYNPNAFANNHHYTTDRGEFETLLSLGWQDEGVGWHGVN